jgi:hypothetical protein
MKISKWGMFFGIEIVLTLGFLTLPNSFYNKPSTLSQYLGYARPWSIALVPVTSIFLCIDIAQAQKKRQQIRQYCPVALLSKFDRIPLAVFLEISQKQIDEAIDEVNLYGQNKSQILVDSLVGMKIHEI